MNIKIYNNSIKIDYFDGIIYISFMPRRLEDTKLILNEVK